MWKISTGENRNAKALCDGKLTNQYFNLPKIHLNFCFQYYEMSYGLNVEMHKQVRFSKLLLSNPQNILNSLKNLLNILWTLNAQALVVFSCFQFHRLFETQSYILSFNWKILVFGDFWLTTFGIILRQPAEKWISCIFHVLIVLLLSLYREAGISE